MPTTQPALPGDDAPDPREKVMGFFDHLEEMRWVIVKCAIALVIGAALVGGFITKFNAFVLGPLNDVKAEYTEKAVAEARAAAGKEGRADAVVVAHPSFEVDLGTTSLAESFTVIVQIVCMGGAVLAAPFMLWFIGCFISPALNERERRLAAPVLAAATALFLSGAAFGFFILVPNTIRMSIEINEMLGFVMRWTPSSYYSLLLWLVLGVGLTFEFPLLVLAAIAIGALRVETLRRYRRHAIVVIFILAAIITPTIDPVSQLLFAAPLYGLYELSLLVGGRLQKKRDLRERAEHDALDDLSKA
ncbi:MAG: twin-arginine translocase subunit TatC [Opitutaceae bacterium]|jgi:sec-independent protein translocase protein TatC|nr:twin-arginine translocase subunit TatC [Opitutaceae bacterium]